MTTLIPRSIVPSVPWPALPDAQAGNMLALQWQFAQSERWPPDKLLAQQMIQIGRLIVHCAGRAPFWRDRIAAAGLRAGEPPTLEAWRRLPLLTRADVQSAGTALFATALPAEHGGTNETTTSGSTGPPMVRRSTELAAFFWRGFMLRETLWHDLDVGGTLAVIRNDPRGGAWPPDGQSLPDWGSGIGTVFATGRAALLDSRSPIPEQVEWLLRLNPHYLFSRASNLADLAQYCLDHDVRLPRLRALRSFADAVTPEVRTACRAAWNVPVLDSYSAQEAGYIALQCPGHEHLHIQSEGVLVEILHDDGTPCAPGEIGRVVVTPLHNFAMPLLRYAIDDYAEVGSLCPCGRTLPVLRRIVGRANSRLMLPNGERRLLLDVAPAFAALPAIQRYQIAQVSAELLEIRLITGSALTAAEQATLTDVVTTSAGHRFAVRFVTMDALPRAPSGKFQDVICEIDG
jgi:phenylacetate-CoA ligase